MLAVHQELQDIFFILFIYTEQLLLIPKITKFLPQSNPGNEKPKQESNPMPYSK